MLGFSAARLTANPSMTANHQNNYSGFHGVSSFVKQGIDFTWGAAKVYSGVVFGSKRSGPRPYGKGTTTGTPPPPGGLASNRLAHDPQRPPSIDDLLAIPQRQNEAKANKL